jgi:hypothetical protein
VSVTPGVDTPGGDPAPASPPTAPAPPAQTQPINAIALAKEVVLDRLERLLTWLLDRLQRYRARRGDWWEH